MVPDDPESTEPRVERDSPETLDAIEGDAESADPSPALSLCGAIASDVVGIRKNTIERMTTAPTTATISKAALRKDDDREVEE